MTAAPVQPPLSARGRYIVDAHGRRVRLAGVNWSGAHEDDGVVSGLDRTGRVRLARAIARHGFNSVRLPFSLWMTEQVTPVPDDYLAANPDLSGSTPMQIYDACVEALTGAGLIVIPNCHTLDAGWCCSESDESGLWFNDRWPAAKFFAAWQSIAERYKANPLVAGMDITNEPRRARVGGRVLTPGWGTGSATDIAAMYTAVGNLIHEISPHLLIICEGLGFAADLTGVARYAVQLEHPGQVVYSLHDYPWYHPGASPGRRTSTRCAGSAGISWTGVSRRCGSASSATTPGRWTISAGRRHLRPGGGTTSKPGLPSTTWTGAGGR
jgi:aryl-phospho-beta-D-glucosidase BglC (GH1 family)